MNLFKNELVRKYFGLDDYGNTVSEATMAIDVICAMEEAISEGDRILMWDQTQQQWIDTISRCNVGWFHPDWLRVPYRFQAKKECGCHCHKTACGCCRTAGQNQPEPEPEGNDPIGKMEAAYGHDRDNWPEDKSDAVEEKIKSIAGIPSNRQWVIHDRELLGKALRELVALCLEP